MTATESIDVDKPTLHLDGGITINLLEGTFKPLNSVTYIAVALLSIAVSLKELADRKDSK